MNINKLIVTYFNLKLILKFILIQYKYDIRHIMNLNKRINWMMFTKFLSKNILQNSVILWLLVYFGTFCIYLIAPQYTFSNTLKICLLYKLLLFQSVRQQNGTQYELKNIIKILKLTLWNFRFYWIKRTIKII